MNRNFFITFLSAFIIITLIYIQEANASTIDSRWDDSITNPETNVITKTIEFKEGLEKTRTKTIELPFIDPNEPINVSVDNGIVDYSINGEQMELTVNNGNWITRESYYDSQKYNKNATNTLTSYSNSFSSTITYSDGEGYTGNLVKDGTSYVISGSYTPPKTKTVTDSKSSNFNNLPSSISYDQDGYVGTLEGQGVTSETVEDGGYWQSYGHYDTRYRTETYTYTVPWCYTVGADGRVWSHAPPCDSSSNSTTKTMTGTREVPYTVWVKDGEYWVTTYTTTYYQEYSGKATKPPIDSRVWEQKYKGTVYKGGTSYRNYTYAYTVAISYEETSECEVSSSGQGYLKLICNESRIKERTKTVQLPFLDSNKPVNVTVDNGDIDYSINGDLMTFTVDNGDWITRESYYDSQKYSKYVTDSLTSSSDSFPSWISYSSGGYSGSLGKSGSSYVSSGYYYPADSKIASKTVSGSAVTDYSCKLHSSGYYGWATLGSYSTLADPPYYYSDSQGYSGWVSSMTYYNKTYDNGSAVENYGSCTKSLEGTTHTQKQSYVKIFEGTVSKPAEDTRIWRQNYGDTVYMGGTSYENQTYAYKVTISYVEHTITGKVYHTEKWKEVHESLSHPIDYFYSGEMFLLVANVNNLYEIENVKVDFAGEQINSSLLELRTTLNTSTEGSRLYYGELYDSSMTEPQTLLQNGKVKFLFTAKWSNGEVRRDIVEVQIIDDVYNNMKLYRTN